jgi:hypothetical protein
VVNFLRLSGEKLLSDIEQNKQIIQHFIQVVWKGRDRSALKDY